MSELCVQHLLRDHRTCEKTIAVLESLLEAKRDERHWSPADSEAFAQVVRLFTEDVIQHIRKEEDVLLPALESFLPRDVGPLAVLRGEHADVYTQFTRLREAGDALASGSADPKMWEVFQHSGRTMIQLVRDHIYKEDRVLFPMVARFLSPERDVHLVKQMEAIGLDEAPGSGNAH